MRLVCSMDNGKQIVLKDCRYCIRQEKRFICDTIVSLFWKVSHHRKACMPFTDDDAAKNHVIYR